MTIILFLLGKQNVSKNVDSFFCYVNKTFNHNFIPELYAWDHTEVFYFSPGQTREGSVTHLGSQVTLPEKATLTISYTYSDTGYPTLFWYVHCSREGPQLLLKATKDKEKEISKEFEAAYQRKSKSFHLKKSSVQESDSVVYYCTERHREGNCRGSWRSLWAAARPGCGASVCLIHSVAQSVVFWLSVSGWYKTHTND